VARIGPVIDVYVERGAKRTFACAIDWPGWCRSGRDEASALEALLDSAPRYARALRGTRLGFVPPKSASGLRVKDRVAGDATTDFGAPGAKTANDARPARAADLRRARAILRACWRAFDSAALAAEGRTLATGPRGGGRALAAIVEHVIEADRGYIGALGGKAPLLVFTGAAISSDSAVPTEGDVLAAQARALGVPADRIAIVSMGEEQPTCREENEACWSQNRRGHFVITAK